MWRVLFVTVAQLIVASPVAWKDLEKEKRDPPVSHRFLYLSWYDCPYAFIGGLWFTRNGDLENALKNSIISVVAVFGAYYIVSYLLNEIADRFDLDQGLFRFQQFTGYASVVMYLLYCLIPFMSEFFIIWLLALYTIQLVHAGAIHFLMVPAHKGEHLCYCIRSGDLIPVIIHALFSFFIQ